MTRRTYIEKILRQIYGDFPNDDSSITDNLVNVWLMEGTALAAKQNYKDNISIDGIGYVNNSFYIQYKGISITEDENMIWRITIPEIPIGLGRNEGISVIQIKDSSGNITLPCIPMTENQRTYYQTMPIIPNKLLFYYEGKYVYIPSPLLLNQYTASITMVSGGDSSDLDSELNIPQDYIPVIDAYVSQQLILERNQPVDLANEGQDFVKTT